jgi:hypothetical protein
MLCIPDARGWLQAYCACEGAEGTEFDYPAGMRSMLRLRLKILRAWWSRVSLHMRARCVKPRLAPAESAACHVSSSTPHQPSASVVASANFVCSRAPSTIPFINAERMWRSS